MSLPTQKCLRVFILPAMLTLVKAHQSNFGHNSVQVLGSQKSSWSGSHSYFRWVPHQIPLPRPSFSIRRVPLPLPYPVFRHHQVPMYAPKDVSRMNAQKSVK
ncbi:hypothetical protein BIW11_05290, partial [Tropilaelaps mercedesae]